MWRFPRHRLVKSDCSRDVIHRVGYFSRAVVFDNSRGPQRLAFHLSCKELDQSARLISIGLVPGEFDELPGIPGKQWKGAAGTCERAIVRFSSGFQP